VPVRATIDSFGPILLSKVLGLNDTQESTLGLIFHWADTRNLPLLDIKDLREVIQFLTGEQGKADLKELGGVSTSTAGVILRAVTNLESQGGDQFFGEPQLDVNDLIRIGADGTGFISLLEVGDLQAKPALYSTFVMWLLAELFEHLPEIGDSDKPKIVFMFDEAHLLFADASKPKLRRLGRLDVALSCGFVGGGVGCSVDVWGGLGDGGGDRRPDELEGAALHGGGLGQGRDGGSVDAVLHVVAGEGGQVAEQALVAVQG